jgi:hypothetical protein
VGRDASQTRLGLQTRVLLLLLLLLLHLHFFLVIDGASKNQCKALMKWV